MAHTVGTIRPAVMAACLACAGLLLAAGCLQVETKVSLQPDGSAVVTERVQFSQELLDLAASAGGDLALAPLLEKPAVLSRMKQMGQGVSLVSHEVRNVGGARESLAVFRIGDINELRYGSPFLAYTDYSKNSLVQCKMVPLYKSVPYHGTAGQMAVSFRLTAPPKSEARPKEGEAPPPGPSPKEVQLLRELGPLFRDIMQGFRIRLTFESYAPVTTGFGMRGRSENATHADLINFTDEDLDIYGSKFLENEEIMLDLVRGDVGSHNVVEQVRQFTGNRTVPVFLPWGSRNAWWVQNDLICFAPSRVLFDRHFAGKKLDYSAWAPSPPDKHVPATWESIGYRNDRAATTQPDPGKRG